MTVKRKLVKTTTVDPLPKKAKVVEFPDSPILGEGEFANIDESLKSPTIEAPHDLPKETPTKVDLLSRIVVSSSSSVIEQMQKDLGLRPLLKCSTFLDHHLLHLRVISKRWSILS